MKSHDFSQLISRILDTESTEIDCDHVQSVLAVYTENAANLSRADGVADKIKLHLTQCPDCNEVYEGLRFLIALDANGGIPEIAPDVKPSEAVPREVCS